MDEVSPNVEAGAAFGGTLELTVGAIALDRPGTPVTTFYQRRGKRLLDIVLGTALSIVSLPILAVAAFAVLVTSGWPIFYLAERLGRNGRPFRMLKLRTMVVNAHDALSEILQTNSTLASEYRRDHKMRHDPRTTRVGAILRKLSIDELPQLWQVITGDMTLVGPRPYAVEEMKLLSRHLEILALTPGVTGPWQVRGRNNLPIDVRIPIDARYASRITAARDIRYLAATFRCLVRPNGH